VAKKRRKTEEKKERFKVPEFDEVEFMQKEIGNTKVALLTIAFSIPIAVLAYFVTLGGLPAAGFLIGIGSIFLLRYLYQFFNVDTDEFKTKDWLGNGAMFFLTWLAVWVLILNMPFSDLTNPTIGKVEIGGCIGLEVVKKNTQNMCEIDNPPTNSTIVSFTSKVTDNAGVESVMLVTTTQAEYPMGRVPGTKEYSTQLPLTEGDSISFNIVAMDKNGHKEVSDGYTITGT
jgi:hypothetical protein